MDTVTIPKSEYQKLKSFSSAYIKIAEDISLNERDFSYDHKYIDRLTKASIKEHKKGKAIEAGSVDAALKKSRGR